MITTLILMSFLSMPSLSMAMSSVESNHNFLVRGDKGKSHGMFQIQPRHHGYVPKSVTGQMAKHDAILLELLQACGHDIKESVSRYNGGRNNKRYVGKVTRAMLQRELLGEI